MSYIKLRSISSCPKLFTTCFDPSRSSLGLSPARWRQELVAMDRLLNSCCLNSRSIATSSCLHLAEERPEDDLLGSKHVNNFGQDEIHLNLIWQWCMYVCKVICPKASPSLDMHYQGNAYLSLLDKRKEWGNMSSAFLTEPVALWEYLSLHTQTQIQLLSIPIPQIAPKVSQP